jgi:hypothetical protein
MTTENLPARFGWAGFLIHYNNENNHPVFTWNAPTQWSPGKRFFREE